MTALASTGDWRLVERVNIFTPLGIRFWDPALDAPVNDGLRVRAYPEGARRPAVDATLTPSGVYAFHGLMGMRDVENSQLSAIPGSLPFIGRFLIEVEDTMRRFLPTALLVDAPYRGIYPTDQPQPGAGPPGIYLFSAPARPASPLLATIRAQLSERLDATHERPAAYAVMEIETATHDIWVGLADQRGALALLFAYPTFTATSSAPSSLPPAPPVDRQSWPLTIRVRYQPSALVFSGGSPFPELRSVLSQAPAAVWSARAAPPGQAASETSTTLVFGQELVMRSEQESVLLISPGSMP